MTAVVAPFPGYRARAPQPQGQPDPMAALVAEWRTAEIEQWRIDFAVVMDRLERGGVAMKVRFEFEIDPRQTMKLEPRDFVDCRDLEELHMDLLDQPDPGWRMYVNQDDLVVFWDEVEKIRSQS